jgi:hypothetical protein
MLCTNEILSINITSKRSENATIRHLRPSRHRCSLFVTSSTLVTSLRSSRTFAFWSDSEYCLWLGLGLVDTAFPMRSHWVNDRNLNKPSEHPHQHTTSISVPEPQILAIRQIFKRMLLALLLVHCQRISSRVLAPQHHVQGHCNADQDRIAADNSLPNTRVVVADFL